MFDHTHYVPILRWKTGEKRALRALVHKDKARMTPLIEWSRPGDVASEEDRETPTPEPRALAQDLLKHWGPRPFLWDPHWFYVGSLGGDAATLGRYAVELRDGGLRPIPVLHLDDDPPYRNALSPLVPARGACVRLSHADLVQPDLAHRLTQFLVTTGNTPGAVHLFADFETFYREVDVAALCSRLPDIGQYMTFTVAAGSFPVDLREFKGPQVFYLPREEWLRWREQIEEQLARRPTFSDYVTIHPLLTPAKRGLNPSATIRYTTEEHWLVMKGEGLHNEDGPGYEQYTSNAALLTRRGDYCGPGFSAGDRYIEDVAILSSGPGNPTTWVQAGVNHHIAFVLRQVRDLFQAPVGRESVVKSSRNTAMSGD